MMDGQCPCSHGDKHHWLPPWELAGQRRSMREDERTMSLLPPAWPQEFTLISMHTHAGPEQEK